MLHNMNLMYVQSISLGKIEKLNSTTWTRDLIVTDVYGNTAKITLFSTTDRFIAKDQPEDFDAADALTTDRERKLLELVEGLTS